MLQGSKCPRSDKTLRKNRTRGKKGETYWSEKNIHKEFCNSNNVYNNFIIQNGDRMEGPFSFLNIQKNSVKNRNQIKGAGLSLVGQSKTKKHLYHLGKDV